MHLCAPLACLPPCLPSCSTRAKFGAIAIIVLQDGSAPLGDKVRSTNFEIGDVLDVSASNPDEPTGQDRMFYRLAGTVHHKGKVRNT